MAFALAIFLISLLLIAVLFAVKLWEEKSGRILFPAWRGRGDAFAREVKVWLMRLRAEAEHIAPTLLRITHTLIHAGALSLASAARGVERELHRLADMVSHKRNFTPREPRNEFLKQVSEHKNGNGDGDADGITV